jgi:hypothetical protein
MVKYDKGVATWARLMLAVYFMMILLQTLKDLIQVWNTQATYSSLVESSPKQPAFLSNVLKQSLLPV